MKLHFWRAGLCGLAGLAAAAAWAGEQQTIPGKLPVEDFARAPQFHDAKLSPDGEHIGYIVRKNESSGLGILTLSTMKAEVFWARQPFAFKEIRNHVYRVDWVGNDRILMLTTLGWAGVNRDLTHFTYLSGPGRWDQEDSSLKKTPQYFYFTDVVQDARMDSKNLHVLSYPKFSGEARFCPEVFRLDARSGAFAIIQKNPGNVKGWLADWDGNIRFGLITDGVDSQLIYRKEPDGPWSKPVEFGRDTTDYGLAGLDADGRTLYVFKPSAMGRKALFAYDLKGGGFGEPLFQHAKYDVESAIFSPKHRRLLGVRYVTEGPRQYWFEPEFAKLQKELDAAHPGLANLIVSMDRELQKMLVFSCSARESGVYSLIDLATHKTQAISATRPWLKPEDMAEVFPVKCKARDGLELNGYLTLPLGRGQKNHPTVVLVHGGPWARDEWRFDSIVQFLANRGYAVLQVNYRGSLGYGEEFYNKGRHQVGGAIQEDITDMARWAVKQGFSDPHRLAVMGASYGGYSTLFALAKEPDMFRCGVACMAVSDWGALFKDLKEEGRDDALRFWNVHIADFGDEKERARLAALSPVNMAAQIKAPLLIMHGEVDTTVPIRQARSMVSALKKAGREPETLFLEHIGHWWPEDKEGVEFLTKLEAFLARHLGSP